MRTNSPYDVLRVSLLPMVGPARGRALLRTFGTFEGIRHAALTDIQRIDGFSDGIAKSLLDNLHNQSIIDQIERIVEENEKLSGKENVAFVAFNDPDYPEPLKRIYDAPLFLHIKGELRKDDSNAVAIVGTRKPSEYGRQAAEYFARELTRCEATVISGLAIGIDTVAHQTTLAHGGRTIAVLGSGIANIYPFTNKKLAEAISAHGCLISECHMKAKPDAVNFPRRNRIISGLSKGTLIVESGIKGGGMITAGLALDQNREVFAIPGSIFNKHSDGPNFLIRKGLAKSVTLIDDIIEEIPSLKKGAVAKRPPVQMSLVEESLYSKLQRDPIHIDDLSSLMNLPTSDLLVQLLQMEFKGLVKQLPGKFFVLTQG